MIDYNYRNLEKLEQRYPIEFIKFVNNQLTYVTNNKYKVLKYIKNINIISFI